MRNIELNWIIHYIKDWNKPRIAKIKKQLSIELNNPLHQGLKQWTWYSFFSNPKRLNWIIHYIKDWNITLNLWLKKIIVLNWIIHYIKDWNNFFILDSKSFTLIELNNPLHQGLKLGEESELVGKTWNWIE